MFSTPVELTLSGKLLLPTLVVTLWHSTSTVAQRPHGLNAATGQLIAFKIRPQFTIPPSSSLKQVTFIGRTSFTYEIKVPSQGILFFGLAFLNSTVYEVPVLSLSKLSHLFTGFAKVSLPTSVMPHRIEGWHYSSSWSHPVTAPYSMGKPSSRSGIGKQLYLGINSLRTGVKLKLYRTGPVYVTLVNRFNDSNLVNLRFIFVRL
jgi:hypothetical protein